jgi:hypothetical protein
MLPLLFPDLNLEKTTVKDYDISTLIHNKNGPVAQ